MIPDPSSYWLNRWNSLHKTIEFLKVVAAKIPSQQKYVNKPEDFQQLLENLKIFGAKQFSYFYFGFSHMLLEELKQSGMNVDEVVIPWAEEKGRTNVNANRLPTIVNNLLTLAGYTGDPQNLQIPKKLIKSYDFPPEYVLRVTLKQIAYDLDILQKAIHQRMMFTGHEEIIVTDDLLETDLSASKEMLEAADLWASESILQRIFQPRANASIVHFSVEPHIRIVPYANVTLVGVSLTATRSDYQHDLLVIAHELGHHAYAHGAINGQPIQQILKDISQPQKPYIKNWHEEIFADVFGFVTSHEFRILPWVIDMIEDNRPRTYTKDNQIHPVDAVRPRVYLYCLEKIMTRVGKADEVTSVCIHFKKRLDNLQEKVGGTDTIPLVNEYGILEYPTIDMVTSELKKFIDQVFEEIFPISGMNEQSSSLWLEQIEQLITIIEDMPEGIEGQSQSTLEPHRKYGGLDISKVLTREQVEPALPIQSVYNQFEEIRDEIGSYDDPVRPEIWQIVFAADGWGFKGPDTYPTKDWESDWEQSAFHR